MNKGSIVGPLPDPIESTDKYAPLLEKIRAMVDEMIAEASEEYRYENPSELYEIINQYFKQDIAAGASGVGSKGYFQAIINSQFSKFCKIFEVQSSATGYGMYNCLEEAIDKTYLVDETGALKTRQLSTDAFLVMNLKESDPVDTGYYPALALYDLIWGWQKRDDEGYLRWVGIPLMNDVRWVRVKEVTPATQNIICNMWRRDGVEATAGLGSAIEVYADLATGINLDDVVPQLQNGQSYPAHCVQGKWWFLQKFDQTGMLRIAKIKSLDTNHYNCRLLAKDKTTELGDADIDVYPEEHLGSTALSGTTVWPDRAVNDFISVYYDIDSVWRSPGTVDDTTECD